MSTSPQTKTLWALQIALGLYFIAVAGANFVGIAPMVEQYDKIGIGQWFRYVTASCQLIGGVALLTQKYSGYGALVLACVMLGALIIRIAILGGNPVMPMSLLMAIGLIAGNKWFKS